MPSATVLNGLLRVRALSPAGFAASLAVLLLATAAIVHLAQAQSSPSISIALSPSHSVPMNTAITGTITLDNLDVDDYSSVIFRADITPFGRGAKRRCNGDDTGRDIEKAVDESREVFAVRVFDACPSAYYSYGSYTLDVSISKVDSTQPNDRIELASARTQFMMSRYLTIGVPTATPPEPGAQAWVDPDPTTFDMYANGEWHLFRFRSNVLLYLNDHLGVQAYGSEFGHFVAPAGEAAPSITVEEACQESDGDNVNWRRAINQGLYIAACRPGDAFIALRHETDAVPPLFKYRVRTLSRGGTDVPEISITVVSSPVIEGADATFTLERSGTTLEALTVNVSVVESGNMLGSSVPDRVSFGATASSATLRVPTDGDHSDERNSLVTVTVQDDTSTPATYTVGAAESASVTVLDDDAPAPPPPPPAPVPVNSTPEFQDANGNAITETTREVAENTPTSTNIGDPVAATDDDDTLTYTLGGADGDSFAIDGSTGQLMTKAPLDEERKNSYSVTVTATDPFGAGATITVSITITDVDFGCSTKGAVVDAANNPGLVADCEALLESRDTLAGTATLDWSVDTSITQWEGVTLRGTPQRVTRLALSNKGLNGTIPSELGRLSMLTHLNLRTNDLTDSVPAELGNLGNLTYLNLHSNRLSGSIPNLSMTMLEELYLANNYDETVEGSGLTGPVPAWLNGMTNMRELWLWGNQLSGTIPDLSGMTSLQKLKLASNNLTGGIPASLGSMSNLKWLIINTNPLGGTIPDLSGMTSLTYLWVHTNGLEGSIPATLGMLPKLDDLNLRDNMLTGEIPDLSGLDTLTRLRLHNNMLSGEIPATLGGLDRLTQLWLYGNGFTNIASGVGDLADTLIEIALSGNSWADDACVPTALANVLTNDYAEADLAICGSDDGS